MTSVEYYKNHFTVDIQNIMNLIAPEKRISIYSLINKDSGGFFGRTRKGFLETTSPRMFLFCSFYTALIDQAIHSSLRIEHQNFEKIAGYPKFVGILSSYGSNMDPALLLLIATVYCKDDSKEDVTKDFNDFTDYMLDDYIDFFHNVFPKYAYGLKTTDEQDEAIHQVFSDIHQAMQWDSVSKEIARLSPSLDLYKAWILLFNDKLSEKMNRMSEG